MSTNAIYAALRTRLSAIAGPVLRQNWLAKSAHIFGPAMGAKPSQKPVGAMPQVNLKARAMRLYNRNDKAASAYERVHVILGSRK